MICPHLLIKTHPHLICRCESTREMSEVKTEQINDYCATEQYDQCRFFQNNCPTIIQEIFHEVYRAVG